jgi:hypothetical protein
MSSCLTKDNIDDQCPVQVRDQRSVRHKPIVFKWSREALPPLYPFVLYPMLTSAAWHDAVESRMLRIKRVLQLPRNTTGRRNAINTCAEMANLLCTVSVQIVFLLYYLISCITDIIRVRAKMFA